MQIIIWGAGGIGAYFGARLQRAGHDVIFIARGTHLVALKAHGLNIDHPDFQLNAKVQAMDQEELIATRKCSDSDLILFAFKSNETERVLQLSADWLTKGRCPVLSIQNGIGNEDQIARVVGDKRTLGGLAVRIGARVAEPGKIVATGIAQIIFGLWNTKPDAQNTALTATLLREFAAAGIPLIYTDDIRYELWRKLIINNGVNPLSAVSGLDTRTVTHDPVLSQTVYLLMQETAVAARFDGVAIDDVDIQEMYDLICSFDAIKTSMLVDREKGRPLEIEAIAGAVMKIHHDHGSTAPLTELLYALLTIGSAPNT